MSKLRYQEQSARGCNSFYSMGTDGVNVARQLLACICDGYSLWKGRYDETKYEYLLTIKGDRCIFGS
jgi:hypothetical protein